VHLESGGFELPHLLTSAHGFHERVLMEIESWPVDVLADYARLVELLGEHVRVFVFRIHALWRWLV
jgi:hypothetical protein